MAYYPTQVDIDALKFPQKILHVKVLLLNDKFQTVYEMQHEYISGGISTNVDSDIRNTLVMTLGVINKNVGISEDRLLWIDQYVKIFFGVQVPFKEDIMWYDKGIFVMTDYSFNAQSRLLQINCSDLVCKLNGDVGGSLEAYETVIYEEDKWTVRDAMIHTLTRFTSFTKYNITDMPKLIPYDLEFGATDTVWTILTKLRDLYKSGCEMYFDTDGTFVCKEIASKESDPIVLDDNILQTLYVSEVDNGVLKDVRNVSKVWGKCLDTDYYTEACEYSISTNTYSAHFTGIALNDDGSLPTSTKFAVKIPSVNKASAKISIYNKSTETDTETLVGTFDITDSLEEAIGANFFVADASFVFRYRRNSMYVLGQWQIQAVNKLRNTEPTVDEKKADVEKHNCDHISYTIMPDSPFAIERIGERFIAFQGGEYDDIQAIDDCITRAEYETYQAARVCYTVTLEMVYIPWLQGNEKIRFKLSESGEMKDWIVKSVSSDHPNGIMNITMEEFHPYYNFVVEEVGLLPDGYTQVEFIQSDGGQYIDLGITGSSDLKFVLDFMSLEVTGYSILGYYNSTNDGQRFFNYGGNAYLDWGNCTSGDGRIYGGSIPINTRMKVEIGNQYVKNLETGQYIVQGSGTGTFTKTNHIFWCGNSDYSKNRLWLLEVYKADVLIGKFIPCTNVSGTAGLYDLVNGVFYTNAGTGEFIAGSVIN